MYVLLLFLLLILVYKNIEYFKYKRVHPYGFPLLKEVNEYINTSECKKITEKIANHPALGWMSSSFQPQRPRRMGLKRLCQSARRRQDLE